VIVDIRLDRQWHALACEDAVAAMGSDASKGLSGAEVEKRRELFGLNILTPSKGHGPFVRFLLQFHQPLL